MQKFAFFIFYSFFHIILSKTCPPLTQIQDLEDINMQTNEIVNLYINDYFKGSLVNSILIDIHNLSITNDN